MGAEWLFDRILPHCAAAESAESTGLVVTGATTGQKTAYVTPVERWGFVALAHDSREPIG